MHLLFPRSQYGHFPPVMLELKPEQYVATSYFPQFMVAFRIGRGVFDFFLTFTVRRPL